MSQSVNDLTLISSKISIIKRLAIWLMTSDLLTPLKSRVWPVGSVLYLTFSKVWLPAPSSIVQSLEIYL